MGLTDAAQMVLLEKLLEETKRTNRILEQWFEFTLKQLER